MSERAHDVEEASFGFGIEDLIFPDGVVGIKSDASQWNVFSHKALKMISS